MKKTIISLGVVGVIAAIAIGATFAYFNDTEKSTGNILVAGIMDLKVDHTKQVYNGVDCKTCSITLISDSSNMVVAKNGAAVTPYPAVYVGSNTGWIHPAWTAQQDPDLLAAGAKWIWEADPTKQEDTTQDVTYTFRKSFEWWGPITGSDLWFGVGSDNSVEVWLNGIKVGENTGEYGYKKESMLHIPGAAITGNVQQGNNVLEFVIKNWALANGSPETNPAGLIYKFFIDGQCEDSYFKTHCQLWGEKDLAEGDHFYDFVDVKPGDNGVNVISFKVYDNDAHACLYLENIDDQENDNISPEKKAGDTSVPQGELSQFLKAFAWTDNNQNGKYEPLAGETVKYGPDQPLTQEMIQLLLNGAGPTQYLGVAWCAGTQAVDVNGIISCSGFGMSNIAQTDSVKADLVAYSEQYRNNENFDCKNLKPVNEDLLINGGFEAGDFTGWQVYLPVGGTATIETSYLADEGNGSYVGPTYGPQEGTKLAVLKTDGPGSTTTVSQAVAVPSGAKFKGWAVLDSQDYLPYNDSASVRILDSFGNVVATPWYSDTNALGNYGETPWTQWQWTALSAGTYTIELGIVNVGDSVLDSKALFDANVVMP